MALTLKKPIAKLHKKEQHISGYKKLKVRKTTTKKATKRKTTTKRTVTKKTQRKVKQLSLFR